MRQNSLPPIKYLDLGFQCRLTSAAQFSAYKGSMLRGSLGAHLRRGLCMARRNDCQSCMLAGSCIFTRIFSLSGSRTAPFCIEPDSAAKCSYAPGEIFEFRLKLFAYGVDYLPFFVQAFRMAGLKGMGSMAAPGQFTIERITSGTRQLYDAENDNIDLPQCELMPGPGAAAPQQGRLTLRIVSPLRHKSGNRFSAALEFGDLFHLILRRLKALYNLEGHDWSLDPEQYAQLRGAAERIRTQANNLRWQDWSRYSSRQDALMKFGGLIGDISYVGDFSMFAELVEVAKIAHIGKQTSFGLGRIEPTYSWPGDNDESSCIGNMAARHWQVRGTGRRQTQ